MDNGHGTVHHAKVGASYGDQIYNARKHGAQIMYGAMWDEYDEGTQFMPAITNRLTSPGTTMADSPSSRMMWTDTTYRRIGTCGLQVMGRQ